MAAADRWLTQLTAERDARINDVLSVLQQEDSGLYGGNVFWPGSATRAALDRLSEAQARLDALTAATA